MTLDERIKYEEEETELDEELARIYKEHGNTIESCFYKERAEGHRQLAEWLKELKAYKENK